MKRVLFFAKSSFAVLCVISFLTLSVLTILADEKSGSTDMTTDSVEIVAPQDSNTAQEVLQEGAQTNEDKHDDLGISYEEKTDDATDDSGEQSSEEEKEHSEQIEQNSGQLLDNESTETAAQEEELQENADPDSYQEQEVIEETTDNTDPDYFKEQEITEETTDNTAQSTKITDNFAKKMLAAPGKNEIVSEEETQTVNGVEYITPEQFGAKGDGRTDDTQAFLKCMKHQTKYVFLKGKYLITSYLSTTVEKYFYAYPNKGYAGASIICNCSRDFKALSFRNVTFENVEFYSTLLRTGKSPHGEKYKRTSNVVFVEVWNGTAEFENCHFIHALIAVRGRKSSGSTAIPQKIMASNCSFTECKIPIQGYCKNTEVRDSSFINDGELYRKLDGAGSNSNSYNGDVYSGDHCIYMEASGCQTVKVSNCEVSTMHSESGASFQIYGDSVSGSALPSMSIENCTIDSNGVASASKANVTINNTIFNEQKAANYIIWVESGSASLIDSEFNHSYAFSYASSTVKPTATGCTFRLMTNLSTTRCNFPYISNNCTYINWGGNVKLDGTSFTDCVFTSEASSVLNKLYISIPSRLSVSLVNTKFKKGSSITNNSSAVRQYVDCSTFD